MHGSTGLFRPNIGHQHVVYDQHIVYDQHFVYNKQVRTSKSGWLRLHMSNRGWQADMLCKS